MNKEKYSVNFHETFRPEIDNICRLIDIVEEYEFLSKEEIFDITGIPTGKDSGKVVPHIFYSKYMNLISYEKEQGKFNLKLTSLGNLIKKEDPYIDEEITKLILSYFLTSKNYGAKMWFLILRKTPEIYGDSVSIKEINKFLNLELNLKKDTKLGPFTGTYNELGDFYSLGLLNIDKGLIEYNDLSINEDFIYVYGYTLIMELKKLDENRIEFNEDEIFEDLLWNRGFGFNKEIGFRVLELLEEKNIIKLNKQLSPVTVLINSSEGEIEDKIYSLLV